MRKTSTKTAKQRKKVLTFHIRTNGKKKDAFYWNAVSANGSSVTDSKQLNTRGNCIKAIAAIVYGKDLETWRVIDHTSGVPTPITFIVQEKTKYNF